MIPDANLPVSDERFKPVAARHHHKAKKRVRMRSDSGSIDREKRASRRKSSSSSDSFSDEEDQEDEEKDYNQQQALSCRMEESDENLSEEENSPKAALGNIKRKARGMGKCGMGKGGKKKEMKQLVKYQCSSR